MESNSELAGRAEPTALDSGTLSLLQPNEAAALIELRQALRMKYELIRLTLVGSKARGDSDSESDIDVVVVLRHLDSRIQFELFDLCFEIGLKHDVLFQPIPYSEQSANSLLVQSTPFYQRIVAEGIAL